ncbi:MAG: DUF4350 domain-containing protein [Candidatus Poseidoniaceae archaeon]|mgnify:FL=1|nr:DUF4350 domain-containing protein [Candidatus Poseidoniaceae archaeon]HIH58365.1 DUF4350 domain-containing protein [Candidatus Poseidoniaceae archaeon]
MDEKPRFNKRRLVLQIAFWFVLVMLLSTVVSQVINIGNNEGQSAYGDDWNDMSAFRQDVKDMGIDTKSLVSSPLLLADIEDPANTTFIIAGVERDTLSLPQFSSDGFLTFAAEDGYTPAEVDAIKEFVFAGGDVLVMDDFGYSSSIAEAFGVRFKGVQLYDTVYVTELDYNFVWMCVQESPCGMDGTSIDPETVENHSRWSIQDNGAHICKLYDGRFMAKSDSGVCEQHWKDGQIQFNSSYQVLLNNITGIDIIPNAKTGMGATEIRALTSPEATIDVNGDGEIWVGSEQTSETPDLWGQFNLSIEVCISQDCNFVQGGRITFIADGSALTNALYDYEGYNNGDYGKADKPIPRNDNRKWALDYIADSLVDTDEPGVSEDVPEPAPNAMVIFDESRHIQPSIASESYNTVYFLLVYFTGEGLAMLLLFLILFIAFEGVLLKKKDPEPWRHVFSIIYYGFGDANRYTYYAKSNKIKQVFLSKVRNQNGLTREEFDSLPARELQSMINDPVLVKFVFENRNYSLEQTVAIVKRIKVWGRT